MKRSLTNVDGEREVGTELHAHDREDRRHTMRRLPNATETASSLAAGDVKSIELVELCIARIERDDERIGAVVVRDFDAARRAARAADRSLTAGERLPLLGVPTTVKESIQVAGLPATLGLTSLRGNRSTVDAPVVQRLRASGAVLLGKTNLAEGLHDWQCANPVYGLTRNPWNTERTSGGSSGGSAAAVAAGFTYLDVGSDVAGSITIPAHFCGVYGHRPSFGLIPGLQTGMPDQISASDLASVGPLARSSVDLALMFDLLCGPIPPESAAYSLRLPQCPLHRLGEFRVLVLESHPLIPTSADVRETLRTLVRKLEDNGAAVCTSHSLLPDLAEATRLYVRLLMSRRLWYAPEAELLRAAVKVQTLRGSDSLTAVGARAAVATHYEWLRWNEQRARLRARWHRVFQDVDVIVCPPSPVRAFAHIAPAPERVLEVDGTPMPYFDQLAWVSLAIGSGLPVTTVPLEHDPEKLPCGVQVIGAFLQDKTTLAFAQALEKYQGEAAPSQSG